VLNIVVPQQGPDPRLTSAILLLPQAVIVILIVLALRRRRHLSVADATKALLT
jgi:hypothetical protein